MYIKNQKEKHSKPVDKQPFKICVWVENSKWLSVFKKTGSKMWYFRFQIYKYILKVKLIIYTKRYEVIMSIIMAKINV